MIRFDDFCAFSLCPTTKTLIASRFYCLVLSLGLFFGLHLKTNQKTLFFSCRKAPVACFECRKTLNFCFNKTQNQKFATWKMHLILKFLTFFVVCLFFLLKFSFFLAKFDWEKFRCKKKSQIFDNKKVDSKKKKLDLKVGIKFRFLSELNVF